jgi:hypothetical protein
MASFHSHLTTVNKHNLRTLQTQPLNELSGALGDLGTLLPLIIALTLTKSISLPATLVFSGIANIATGLAFGIPLPVQPMKAIAAIAISQSYTKAENASAGLFVGGVVTLLSLTGLLKCFGRLVPVPVVRGIQVGAGLALCISAGSSLLQPLGWVTPSWSDNWIWAVAAFLLLVLTSLLPRIPYALIVFLLGLIFSGIQLAKSHPQTQQPSTLHPWHPIPYIPSASDFRKGAIGAGIPQLPLTTLNSILAVTSLSKSLFPTYPFAPSNTAMGLSIGMANLVGCCFGAMPICHGSGGLAAQYKFGARSGASIIILGIVKLLLGLVAGESIIPLLLRFPKALLGVMVLAAGVELAKVGQSLDINDNNDDDDQGDTNDVWANTEQENDNQQDMTYPSTSTCTSARPDKRRRSFTEQERRDRWTIMLVTVAGCLAFKNDAVGFLAGMLWHCAIKAFEQQSTRSTSTIPRRLTRFFTSREEQQQQQGIGRRDEQREPLLA